MQTEDLSFLAVDAAGKLTRQGTLAVGVTGDTPDPTKGGNGEIVRVLPLAKPARRLAVERGRERHWRAQGRAAEQGYFRQLAAMV
jgi:hypothetical protein